MITKLLISTALISGALATSALAQTTPTTTPSTMAPAMRSDISAGSQWRVSKLIGLDIYNDQNEKLGDVTEILIEPTGNVTGVVIGVGGFLGMGQRDIMITMDKLRFVSEPMRTSATTPASPPAGTAPPASTMKPAPAASTASKWYPDHAVLPGVTKEQLKTMTEFKFE